MTQHLQPIPPQRTLDGLPSTVFSDAIKLRAFTDYQRKKSRGTVSVHLQVMQSFSKYLSMMLDPAPTPDDLLYDPRTWSGMAPDILRAYINWMIGEGYSILTVNKHLSIVKTYAKLAVEAGILGVELMPMFSAVKSISFKEGVNIEKSRATPTRSTRQNAESRVPLSIVQFMKARPETFEGQRDRLLICLVADHGLRIGEIFRLTAESFDLSEGTFTFYREKVLKTQIHKMTPDTMKALLAYRQHGGPTTGSLWVNSRGEAFKSVRTLQRYVTAIAADVNVKASPHNFRHMWATSALKGGSTYNSVKQGGGWSSIKTVDIYYNEDVIANEGIKLAHLQEEA